MLDSYTSEDQVWQDPGHWKDGPARPHEDEVGNRGGKENGPGSPFSRRGVNWQTQSQPASTLRECSAGGC